MYDSRPHTEVSRVEAGGTCVLISGSETPPLVVKGDTKFMIYDKPMTGLKTELGHFWVHTAFLIARCEVGSGMGTLHFRREDMDKACKKKYADRYPPDFEVILHFEAECEGDAHASPTHTDLLAVCEGESDVEDDEGDDEEDELFDAGRSSRLSMTRRPSASSYASALSSTSQKLLGLLRNKRQDVSTVF